MKPVLSSLVRVTRPEKRFSVAGVGPGLFPCGSQGSPRRRSGCRRPRRGDAADKGENTMGTALVTIDSADTYFKGDGCNDWTRR